ncbi:MAG: FMN-binding protein [Eubacteriales bacterium]|nr:FMN-binding protein [Eubacteriales bacterium]
MKLSKKNIIRCAMTFLLLVGFVWGIIYLKSVADYKQAVKETAFEKINISDVSDGVYIGEYDVKFIYAKVEVTVQNGEITNISISEHRHERGKTAEAVTNRIVDEQKIDVDAISGATNSSTVIKKAVANALCGRNRKFVGMIELPEE